MTDEAVPGSLLVVCTGNVCRSPYVQLLLEDLLREQGSDVDVVSGGTRAMVGAPPARIMSLLLLERGVELAGFHARQVTDADVDAAAMVLTATREHRTDLVRRRPRAHARVFTLLQAQRILEVSGLPLPLPGETPVEALARHCHRTRAAAGPSAGAGDDVPDPWQRKESDYRAAADLMAPAVELVAQALLVRPRA